MAAADAHSYLASLVQLLNTHWPDNRTVNIVCHGHSVPSGYFATPMVDTFNAYPHLLHRALKHRFPFAVINVIVTAIGGESSVSGAERFERDVLCHQPDVVSIDYALNDRGAGLEAAEAAWRSMIDATLARDVKLILLTPTVDVRGFGDSSAAEWSGLLAHAEQVRRLADEYDVGLVDSLAAFEAYVADGGDISDLMTWLNHPNARGHAIVAERLTRYFAIHEV